MNEHPKDRKVVIVTGGSSGIGLYLSEHLLELGHRVAVLDIKTDAEDALGRFGDEFLFCSCDVSRDSDVPRAVRAVWEKWQRIDILVNNACRAVFERLDNRTVDSIRAEFEVNYFGALRVIKAVLPHMKRQGGGTILNVSSGVGITGFPGMAGYTSAKGALESLTKTLSLEFGEHNIRVGIIHPPLTNTESARPLGVPPEMMEEPKKVGQRLARRILSGARIITPDAKTACFTRLSYIIPYRIGALLSKMTERARAAARESERSDMRR